MFCVIYGTKLVYQEHC